MKAEIPVGGYINYNLYFAYRKRQEEDHKRLHQIRIKVTNQNEGSKLSGKNQNKWTPQCIRSVQRHALIVAENDGERREITPADTLWWAMYVNIENMSDRIRTKFRRRFRVPYHEYKAMVLELKEDVKFKRWTSRDENEKNVLQLNFSSCDVYKI